MAASLRPSNLLHRIDTSARSLARALRSGPALLACAFAFAFALVAPAFAQTTVSANWDDGALITVDLATGNRTVLSSPSVGTGPNLFRSMSLAQEASGSILVGEDDFSTRLFRVDPVTGDRVVLSSDVVGTGPSLDGIFAITLDSAGNIYVAGGYSESILKVNPITGDRTVVSSASVGTGDPFNTLFGLVAESDTHLIASASDTIYRVDIATGNRTVISSPTVGSGPTIPRAGGVCFLPDGNLAVICQYGTPYVIKVDLTTGNRTALTGSGVGTGPALSTIFNITTDASGNLYVPTWDSISKVDPATGNRSVVSSSGIGTGVAYTGVIVLLPSSGFRPTPTPSPTPTPTPTAAPTPSPSPSPSPTPTVTPTPSPSPSPSPTPTATPTPTVTPSPSPSPTPSPSPVPTATPTPSPSPTVVPSPSPTPQPTATPTPVPTSTPIPTPTPVPSPTPSPTSIPSPTPTATPTPSPTPIQAGPQVFFGQSSTAKFAASLHTPDRGQAIGYLPGQAQVFTASFTVSTLGQISGTATVHTNTDAASLKQGQAIRLPHAMSESAISTSSKTVSGTLSQGTLHLTLEGSPTYLGDVQAPTGSTATLAGYYEANAINSAAGSIRSIVGTSGRILSVVVSNGHVSGAEGSVNADGTFTHGSAGGLVIQAALDVANSRIVGTLSEAGGATTHFSGTRADLARTDRLINLSSRALVGPDDNHTLISGFVVRGSEAKRVLIRAAGPGLSQVGVGNPIPDPGIVVFSSGGTIVANVDDWQAADAGLMQKLGAFPFQAGSKDAATVMTLEPGAYSVHVRVAGATGVALAEIYDASLNPESEYQRLINISSRGYVSVGDGALIGGFVITGNTPKRVLLRGVGPTLGRFSVSPVLGNPLLEVYDGQTRLIARNDDWQSPTPIDSTQTSASGAEIVTANLQNGAFPLDDNSRDAAVVITLVPGLYTAVIKSADGKPGVGLIEIYELAE